MKLQTKLFLDGGDPEETREVDRLLKKAGLPGLQGQTTNPTLIAKNLGSRVRGQGSGKVTEAQALEKYRRIVMEMAKVTSGPISIQVLTNERTTAEEMLSQARDHIRWIPNAVIKFPCIAEGLKAAEIFCQEGPVNMTLVFSEEQAAAVYAATVNRGVDDHDRPFDVFVSPYVGRHDDIGDNGMDVVANIVQMYRGYSEHKVNVLAASVRNVKQLLYTFSLTCDAVTAPTHIYKEWTAIGCPLPADDFIYDVPGLMEIPYKELSLDKDWKAYNISHPMTTAGLKKFWDDWNDIVA